VNKSSGGLCVGFCFWFGLWFLVCLVVVVELNSVFRCWLLLKGYLWAMRIQRVSPSSVWASIGCR
jgi:hypothetical protein